MKKFFVLAAALMSGLLLSVSCQDPLLPEDPDEALSLSSGKTMIIKATIAPRAPESKTVLNAGETSGTVYWSAGDQIRVYSTSHPEGVVFTLKTGDGTASASFIGDAIADTDGPFYFVYPADAAGTQTSSGIPLNVPAAQTYVANSFALGSCIAAGYSDALDNITLKPLSGVLMLQLKGNKRISKINVYTKAAENLCGAATLSYLSDTPVLNFDSEQTVANPQCVTLDCSGETGGGVQLGATTTNFFVALPVGVFADGFYLEMVDTEDNVMVKYSGANEITGTKIRKMAVFEHKPQYEKAFMIESVAGAAVTGVKPEDGDDVFYRCSYDPGWGQFAYSVASGKRTVRIQNWDEGYALSLEMPDSVTPGTEVEVTVTVLGTIAGISSGTVSNMRVLKKEGKRVWLANGSTGYIMLLED